MEALTSILHYCLLDSINVPQFFFTRRHNSLAPSTLSKAEGISTASAQPPINAPLPASSMTSVVGSAFSAIPGTGLINSLFSRFTSSDTSLDPSKFESKSSEYLNAQKEIIARFPNTLAILCDVWKFTTKHEVISSQTGLSINTYQVYVFL